MSEPTVERDSEGTDPRNQTDTDQSMPGSYVDSAHNMPGDQPEDDTPPSKTLADGTRSRDELDD